MYPASGTDSDESMPIRACLKHRSINVNMMNDRNLLLMHSYQKPKSPRESTLQPAVVSPKRVPDRQMGHPPFVLGGQFPITAYYVNPRSVFRQG